MGSLEASDRWYTIPRGVLRVATIRKRGGGSAIAQQRVACRAVHAGRKLSEGHDGDSNELERPPSGESAMLRALGNGWQGDKESETWLEEELP